jgi:glycerol-3-phosphate dehydrogenase
MALYERVVHLDDLILRRTLMGLLGEVNGALLEELAGIASPVLGWTQQEAAAEVERTIQLLEKVYGVTAEARSKSSFR